MLVSGSIIFIATGGKLIGSILGSLIGKGTIKEGIIMGWGLNARGAVEIMVVRLAFEMGYVEPIIYSSIILMTFVTTIISPIIFKYVVTSHTEPHKSVPNP